MKKIIKEIVAICTEEKMAEWLRRHWERNIYEIVYDETIKSVEINYNNTSREYQDKYYFWLPINYNTKHNCLQVEWLLCRKLGCNIKEFFTFWDDWTDIMSGWVKVGAGGTRDYFEKSYVVQCLYWLKSLVGEDK